MNAELETYIKQFLKNRRFSKGGWATVTKRDIFLLGLIMERLIELKFQRDTDGDLPVEFSLVNRNTHRRDYFRPEPYGKKSGPNTDVLKVLLSNVRTANEALSRFLDVQSYNKKSRGEK